MFDYDARLELAPRDVVSRAIDAEMRRLETWCVYLDMAHLPTEAIRKEFPTIFDQLASIGIEPDREWIPVVPAQHYSCGGVTTDLDGRTSLPGLYAAGEAACTGVHGANRLASNSLLEALVFAQAAADASADEPMPDDEGTPVSAPRCIPEAEAIRIRRHLQKTMMNQVGIVRTDKGLAEALRAVDRMLEEFRQLPEAPFSPYSVETRNLLVAARYVITGAITRRENVGLHYNADLAPEDARRGGAS